MIFSHNQQPYIIRQTDQLKTYQCIQQCNANNALDDGSRTFVLKQIGVHMYYNNNFALLCFQ